MYKDVVSLLGFIQHAHWTVLGGLDDLSGFIIGEHNVNNIYYTDDTVLMENSERKLK